MCNCRRCGLRERFRLALLVLEREVSEVEVEAVELRVLELSKEEEEEDIVAGMRGRFSWGFGGVWCKVVEEIARQVSGMANV